MEFLVRKAGEIALQIKPAAHEKGQHDYVTEADLAVSSFLTRQLPLLSEGSGVYSEEGESHDCRKGKWFVIDPIDGTTNLMYSLNLSAISCAYMEDGETLNAIIYNPFSDELFRAEKDCGSILNGQPIHVNHDTNISHSLIGFESGPATVGKQKPFFDALYTLLTLSRGLRQTGSAAIDLCYIACGRLSAVPFHYLFPWDYAAGELILKEAGGLLTTGNGAKPNYSGRSNLLIASNGLIHNEMLSLLKYVE